MSIAISVENVSKQYRLGKIGTGSLAHDVNRWWHAVRGKEDPYLKVGQINDRASKNSGNYVWALKDISFEVKQGDLVGVIGKNGAGKSTLLKILSRTTLPTTGAVRMKGRVASLLEVGTGFHPELTGKENIFLNGAILGMSKHEIKSKFDQIIDFAGVEKYVDTPVKRYSSGMYVRLAFAVAAHLEPEILIVDEVLAVGDAEFQAKAIGKMQAVSNSEGRTVLFVSHNMASLSKLCNSGILLNNGNTRLIGPIDEVIAEYLSQVETPQYSKHGVGGIDISNVLFKDKFGHRIQILKSFEPCVIELEVQVQSDFANVSVAIGFNDVNNVRVFSLWTKFKDPGAHMNAGFYRVSFEIPELRVTPGRYVITTYIESNGVEVQRIDTLDTVIVAFVDNSHYLFEPKPSQGLYMENFSYNIEKLEI